MYKLVKGRFCNHEFLELLEHKGTTVKLHGISQQRTSKHFSNFNELNQAKINGEIKQCWNGTIFKLLESTGKGEGIIICIFYTASATPATLVYIQYFVMYIRCYNAWNEYIVTYQ